MDIIKASGEKESFNGKKIYSGIILAGGSKKLARETIEKVRKRIREGKTTTEDILTFVLDNLRKEKGVAARYDLKRAIMSLGPSGFPFEKYVSSILKEYGYSTEVGVSLKGKRVMQEIDVIAKNKEKYMIECKYHNNLGKYAGLKEAMYTYARFLDVKKHGFNFPWLITNTKCSISAVNYSKGINLKITGWKYPKNKGLKELIERKNLYPITIIRTIDSKTKEKLYSLKIMLAKSLLEYSIPKLIEKTGLKEKVIKNILEETKAILHK
jgi:hypothetical protein